MTDSQNSAAALHDKYEKNSSQQRGSNDSPNQIVLGQSQAQKQLIRNRKKNKDLPQHDEYEEDFERDDLVTMELPKKKLAK